MNSCLNLTPILLIALLLSCIGAVVWSHTTTRRVRQKHERRQQRAAQIRRDMEADRG